MIVGIGVDVVAVPDFAEQLGRPGTAFARAFTPGERRDAAGAGSAETPAERRRGSVETRVGPRDRPTADQAKHLAARWAAKEAFVKAWSSANYGRPPVRADVPMREIEVVCDAWGRPAVKLRGDVAAAVRESLGETAVHVSLSHDGDVAVAYVVLERA